MSYKIKRIGNFEDDSYLVTDGEQIVGVVTSEQHARFLSNYDYIMTLLQTARIALNRVETVEEYNGDL